MKETMSMWEYDGTFSGFLTIVYTAFRQQLFPVTIVTSDQSVETLFLTEYIQTDETLADKVAMKLKKRLKKATWQFIIDGFYCSLESKERYLLDAIEIGLQSADSLLNFLGHTSILSLNKAIHALRREAHAYTGFIRFEYMDGVLYSEIKPKHFSLPYICPHFSQRYPSETLLIYDETHHLLALIEKSNISFIENTAPPILNCSKIESTIQTNWRTFLQAATIHERENKRVQLSHLPKRFRSHMVDFN